MTTNKDVGRETIVRGAAGLVYNIELRDLFAGLIACGLVSNGEYGYGELAKDAYEKADEMLVEREKTRSK